MITIEVSSELRDKLRAKAAAQGYANESEYLREHIQESVDEDDGLEHWVRTVGVERYDAYDKNPKNVLTAEEVFGAVIENLRARGRPNEAV